MAIWKSTGASYVIHLVFREEIQMKTIVTKLAGVVCGLLLSLTAWSDVPSGVCSADVSTGACFGQIVVAPPGDFSPILDGTLGIMIIQLVDAQTVLSNSANGNRHLPCHFKDRKPQSH